MVEFDFRSYRALVVSMPDASLAESSSALVSQSPHFSLPSSTSQLFPLESPERSSLEVGKDA